MEPATEQLDEVMVVAYGTTKKSSFTGAASQVSGEKLQKLQVSNITKGLEGAMSGVQTTVGSGTPGASSKIIIRGLGSISASQNPLIVVDGVPYEGSLNSISPQDIESLTVLKDAAANSMYGARGSNGVIIITTKGGRAGKTQVNFEGRFGFNSRGIPIYDIIQTPGPYYEMMYESIRNSLTKPTGTLSYMDASILAANTLISKYLKYNAYKDVADTDLINPYTGKLNSNAQARKWHDNWADDPFNNGTRQEYNLNVSGGTDKTTAYLSIGYLSDEGYVVNSSFDRISTRLKVQHNIGDYVRIGGNIAYSHTNQNQFGDTNSNYSNIFMFSQMIGPIYPIYLYDAEGKKILDSKNRPLYDFGTEYKRPYASESNPYAVALENKINT
jgi:TonB-dependent outer membrane receptor, SusC/RagA subfamily, signature region